MMFLFGASIPWKSFPPGSGPFPLTHVVMLMRGLGRGEPFADRRTELSALAGLPVVPPLPLGAANRETGPWGIVSHGPLEIPPDTLQQQPPGAPAYGWLAASASSMSFWNCS